MANTLNLGTGGNWAAKEGSLLAYNNENGNFKPLPFDFTRASIATRVNSQGLIEVVGSDQPRVDFLNDTDGALLLEPSRSNLITYSEDFTQGWGVNNLTRTSNQAISPDGTQNADLITNTSTNGYIAYTASFNANLEYTFSVFVKAGTSNLFSLVYTPFMSQVISVEFDLSSETATVNTGTPTNFGIDNFGNGWFRIFITEPKNATTGTSFVRVVLSGSTSDTGYIWGAQLEEGSYATSYIPTQGAAVTRVVDGCEQTPPNGIIGQTEGVMYLDFISNTDTISTKWLSFLGSGSEYIGIYVVNTSNVIRLEVANTTNQATFNSSFPITKGTRYKCAIAYANNDFTAYINGVQIGTDNSGTVPSTTTLRNYYNLSNIESTIINDLQLYNTRLSNEELQALTTI